MKETRQNNVIISSLLTSGAGLQKILPDNPRRNKLMFISQAVLQYLPDSRLNNTNFPGFANNTAVYGRNWVKLCRCEFGEIVRMAWYVNTLLATRLTIIEELDGGF